MEKEETIKSFEDCVKYLQDFYYHDTTCSSILSKLEKRKLITIEELEHLKDLFRTSERNMDDLVEDHSRYGTRSLANYKAATDLSYVGQSTRSTHQKVLNIISEFVEKE